MNRFFALTRTSKTSSLNLWVIERTESGSCRMEKLASRVLHWDSTGPGANKKHTASVEGEVTLGTIFWKADRVLITQFGGICLFRRDRRFEGVGGGEEFLRAQRLLAHTVHPYWRGRTERVFCLSLKEPTDVHWEGWSGMPEVDFPYSQPWFFDGSPNGTETIQVLKTIGPDDPNILVEDGLWESLPLMNLNVNERAIVELGFKHQDLRIASEEMRDPYEEMRELFFGVCRKLGLEDPVDADRQQLINAAYWKLINLGLLFVPPEGLLLENRFLLKSSPTGFCLSDQDQKIRSIESQTFPSPASAINHLKPYQQSSRTG